MNSVDFCFWLQGFFEVAHDGQDDVRTNISPAQVQVIRDHLNLVFVHEIDPLREGQTPASADKLNAAHSGNDVLMRC